MKALTTFALTALLATPAAFAAGGSAAAPTAKPPLMTPAANDAAPANTAHKACAKQATEKNLTGTARESFLKECAAKQKK